MKIKLTSVYVGDKDDAHADYERMKARGAEFTVPPAAASRIAMLSDSCGNLIQVTQLMAPQGAHLNRWRGLATISDGKSDAQKS